MVLYKFVIVQLFNKYMLQLNTSQGVKSLKSLYIGGLQIRGESVSLMNKRVRGILILAILNYEIICFC
jgi:hypothetical protein